MIQGEKAVTILYTIEKAHWQSYTNIRRRNTRRLLGVLPFWK